MKKYVIVNTSELNDPNSTIDFSQLPYTGKEGLRYNLDGDRAVIKYETPIPSFFSGRATYTFAQISEILQGFEWTKQYTQEEIDAMSGS